MSIITVRDLVKEYHRPKRQTGRFGALRTLLTREVEVTRAIDGISFTVAEGELLGYIGANGAGKSTTIKRSRRLSRSCVRCMRPGRKPRDPPFPKSARLPSACRIAFMAYFPATVLLSRTGELSVRPLLAYLSPLVGAALFAATYRLMQHETRHYQSSGH